ncbi:hypothetical protein SCG7109_AE_00110 [Chlamydiales bacterium SCGC AG-110-M15]|nr:hypothetical protein SCG7109_AE_00110 [Chlamydiales bacterium SCGC AG-110-M15]
MLLRVCAIFVCVAVIMSCGRYTTPLYNDPLFRKKSADRNELGLGGEPYGQRDEIDRDLNRFTPASNESYDDFAKRISNTLLSQEYEKDQLMQAIERKDASKKDLMGQMNKLLTKNIDLRLTLMRMLKVDDGTKGSLETLFKRYTIKPGDTLQQISHKHFGTYTGWLAIYRFNRDAMPYGPNRIHPGQVIYLPKVRKFEKGSSN